jgi:hypothetical protein
MSGHQAKLKAQRTGAASVPILLACVCVLALALVFSACGGGSTTASSQLPTQLSPEQILAGVLAVVQGAGAAGSATGAASGEMVVQGEGDILLEPAGSAGPESFAGEVHVVRGPTTTFSLPARTSTTQSPTTLAPGQVAAWSGGTPGLYGGSRSKAKCDKELQLRFLEQNPAKAAAFCAALNSDPTLRWSGGNKVIPEQLRAYFAELTPMVLTRDTRVTNHGFRNGYPTPRQSVLQAGQGVLVDRYGVPRVRCECGNPLNPPQPVKTTPKYTGPKWTNFDPTTIIIIQQTTVIIDIFVVVDVDTGESFNRPAGSAGEKDTPHEVTTTTSSTTTSSTASTTTTLIIDHPDINGHWAGSYTFTAIDVPASAESELEAQGCSVAELKALEGKPLPMTLDLTVDAQGKGTGVLFVDFSSVSADATSEPQNVSVSYVGNTVTLTTEDGTETKGVVSSKGGGLVIGGTQTQADQGISITATWQVTQAQ